MPSTATRFEDISPPLPDLEALAGATAAIVKGLQGGSDLAACRPFLEQWNGLRCEVETYSAFVDLRFNQDTRNADAKQAREDWDKASPRWTELQVEVKRVLLGHPLRNELEEELGSQAFSLWESEALSFDPVLMKDLTREAELVAAYTELTAGAEIEFQGETLNLSTISKHRQSEVRDVRHGAEQKLWEWFGANADKLDENFDALVKLRHGMACKLGLKDFVDLGYKRMCRVDYDQDDVKRFRRSIVDDIVPLAAELTARQAKGLGVDQLMAWDEFVHDKQGNPRPKGDRAWMVERGHEMFKEIGGGLDDFFRLMDDGDLLDLDARKGKAPGGFCTSFPTHGVPFVYANFNGTKGDIEVLTHEIGHAFQCYSSKDLFPIDYFWATYEACEVHSMGLEFLTYPQMEKFFGDDADRFRRVHMTESIVFLPYGTAVDHFQHELYSNPAATPAERHEMWREMERIYLPWRDWGDLSYPAKGGRWQLQSHIFGSPFYYIDYVLAQTCALQLWASAEEDRASTLEAYVSLCKKGGSQPFQTLVRSVGLTSPFDPGCLTKVVGRARGMLSL